MLYKFKSQAGADVIMQAFNGDQMLALIGKEASPQGIITVAQMPAALSVLEAATASQPALKPEEDEGADFRHYVGPFIDLLRCSLQAGKDVVWGV
jgi:hypothetical protein